MIKKTSELVPGEMVRNSVRSGFIEVTFIEQVNEIDFRVGQKDLDPIVVPGFYAWEVLEVLEKAPQTPKLYRASELKIGEMVRLSEAFEYFPWKPTENENNDPIWQKQEQAQPTPAEIKLPTLTNEQLERIVVGGLSQLFLLAKELAPQEPTDLSDFEWGIRYCQNIIMARTMWRPMKAELDKESQNNDGSLTNQ